MTTNLTKMLTDYDKFIHDQRRISPDCPCITMMLLYAEINSTTVNDLQQRGFTCKLIYDEQVPICWFITKTSLISTGTNQCYNC